MHLAKDIKQVFTGRQPNFLSFNVSVLSVYIVYVMYFGQFSGEENEK